MSTFRTSVGCILVWMTVVSCDAWTPQALGNHLKHRSVSRQVTTIRGTASRGYVMVPVLIQSSSVSTVSSPGSSIVSPNSAPTKPQSANAQATLPSVEVIPPSAGGDAAGGDAAGEPEAKNKGEEGTSAADAEKCKKDREALTEELKQLKASSASEKLSEALGKAEADLSEAAAAHQIAAAALAEAVQQSKALESEFQSLVASLEVETHVYSEIADKASDAAKASAGKIAEQSVKKISKEQDLDVHALQLKTIKSNAVAAAAAYHASQIRFKTLTEQAYGK